jgi:eukaryotic-like serine/threonine-protein kinase
VTDTVARLSAALEGRYRLVRELGQGGMATVYLAEDLKHDRKVALKVLRPELAAVLGAERFVQEIKTTAALSHPHILPLFDSGEAGGFLYYVMPYIEGETIREKLNRETQLGIEEAVRITSEVADALDYAHRHGVIHRDIKPENILLHDGRPMVMDFGIALAVSAAAGGRMTETGMSLGTPHYMSPEQATAEKDLTSRSDTYSLGSVLYEMLTGEPPHIGNSAQAIIMKIVTEDAAPVTRLRKSVPTHVAGAVAKSLERLPADRFETAKAFADALANPAFDTARSVGPLGPATRPVGSSARRPVVGALTALTAVSAALAAWGWLRPRGEPTLHVSVPAPAGTSFIGNPRWPALTPDGRTIVFAAGSEGDTRLYRRPVDGFRAEVIDGSEGATYPFMSPDGAWVGYYTSGRQLRKVPLMGGQSVAITNIPFWESGAVWRHNGTIVVISDTRGLYVVPDHGGDLIPLTVSDSAADAMSLVRPQELPDGRLTATRIPREVASHYRSENGQLIVLDDEAKQWRDAPGDDGGLIVPPHFLISRLASGFQAQPYELSKGGLGGRPLPVLEGAGSDLVVNARGDVAYFAFPGAPPRFLTMVDRTGAARRLPVPAQNVRHPRLSRDGRKLAVNQDGDLWVLDLATYAWTRLTTNADITEPQWSPDDRRLLHTVFDTSSGFNPPAIRAASGLGDTRVLQPGIGDAWTSDWSPDGRRIAVYGGKVGINVFVVDVDSAATAHVVTNTRAIARNARFSPDGRWLAYQSNETGRMQVYVVSYPDLAIKRPISTDGGTEPAWRPQGGELYYRNGPSMMVVPIRTSPGLEVGTPHELFRGPWLEDIYGDRSYDVTPDGTHFLMLEANPAAAPELRVIRNWGAELDATVSR